VVLTRLEDPGRNGVLGLSADGSWLVFEGDRDGELVSEVTVDHAALLTLAPGPYLVRHRDERGIRERAVDLSRGETLELHAADMVAVSLGATVRKGLSDERHAAWALTAGGGVMGPTTPGLRLGPTARLGALVDLEPMTLTTHVVGSTHRGDNAQLELTQGRLGVDVAGIKKVDVAAVAVGLGVRAGGDLTRQWFSTPGQATPRQALSGRVGPVLSLDLGLGSPRSLATIEATADINLYNRYTPTTGAEALTTSVVPTVLLELARYVH
jgi:hypothetical protein